MMGEDGTGMDELGETRSDRDLFPGGGRDGNKTVGARIGLDLAPRGIDVGVSAQTGNYSDDPDLDLSLTFLGVDAAARFFDVELRGELFRANQESTAGMLHKTGGYVQAAFRMTSRLEPVVRYSALDMPETAADRRQFALGLNLYVSPASSVRLNYRFNGEKAGFTEADDALAAQFNIVF